MVSVALMMFFFSTWDKLNYKQKVSGTQLTTSAGIVAVFDTFRNLGSFSQHVAGVSSEPSAGAVR